MCRLSVRLCFTAEESLSANVGLQEACSWDGPLSGTAGADLSHDWAEPGLRVRPCKMVVGRGWMEVQGMSGGEVHSCQFLLKSTSGCFRS